MTCKVSAACGSIHFQPFIGNMGYLVKAVVILGLGGIAYVWLTSTVPGGEKRYEHYIREAKDRSNMSAP